MTTATTGLKLKTYRNDHGHEFQAVEIDGVLVSLSKKDMSKSRNFLAKARVYGAVDALTPDLNALEPAYPYRGSGATDADRLTEKLWDTWARVTKRTAEQRLSALLAKLVEAWVEDWKFSDNVFKNIKFSYKAGCSCGCSPGFILDGRVTDGIWNSDIHLSTLDGLKEVK
mgnify:FL=1